MINQSQFQRFFRAIKTTLPSHWTDVLDKSLLFCISWSRDSPGWSPVRGWLFWDAVNDMFNGYVFYCFSIVFLLFLYVFCMLRFCLWIFFDHVWHCSTNNLCCMLAKSLWLWLTHVQRFMSYDWNWSYCSSFFFWNPSASTCSKKTPRLSKSSMDCMTTPFTCWLFDKVTTRLGKKKWPPPSPFRFSSIYLPQRGGHWNWWCSTVIPCDSGIQGHDFCRVLELGEECLAQTRAQVSSCN